MKLYFSKHKPNIMLPRLQEIPLFRTEPGTVNELLKHDIYIYIYIYNKEYQHFFKIFYGDMK